VRKLIIFFLIPVSMFLASACRSPRNLSLPYPNGEKFSGSSFYSSAAAFGWKERDSLALQAFYNGNIPAFFGRLKPVKSRIKDSAGRKWLLKIFVTPDYFMVGNKSDWARVPITPMAAQKIADYLECFLPTKKIVDMINTSAKVKLDPVPMYAYRDSTVTMWQHHLMIEGQRKGRKGLISGIKKDIVICSEAALKGRQNRVAIYGWHRSDGRPIQSLYTGHVNWYVDYSHGIRFVHRMVRVNRKWMNYQDLLEDEKMKFLITDEKGSMLLRY
jgi:hypothetical protein